MVGGDAAMVVALADSLFFDMDLNAARTRVMLFLALSFAPFLFIAPLIGPMIDRMPGGRRFVIQGVALSRTVLLVLMAQSIDSLALFPLVFASLVLQKTYIVSKSALVPSTVRSTTELIEANSKLGLMSGVAGAVAVVPAAIVLATLVPSATIRLPLIAMALEAGVPLELDDFPRIGAHVTVLADLRPSGQYLMSELIALGGVQPLMKRLLNAGLLHGHCMTVTGKTMAENLADVEDYPDDQNIIRDFTNPIKKDSHLVVLYGNLASEGAVAKITGKEGMQFTGSARVFASEEEALQAILAGVVVAGDVLVIR